MDQAFFEVENTDDVEQCLNKAEDFKDYWDYREDDEEEEKKKAFDIQTDNEQNEDIIIKKRKENEKAELKKKKDAKDKFKGINTQKD